jgi:hypothetical protein
MESVPLTLDLPASLRQFVERQAADEHITPEQYAIAVLESLRRAADAVEDDVRAANAFLAGDPGRLERLLREGLDSGPALEANDDYWKRKLSRPSAPPADRGNSGCRG